MVAAGMAVYAHSLQARVLLHLPIEEARHEVSRTIAVLEPGPDPATTIARIGGDADWIARYLVGLECRFEVLEPDEVRTEVRDLAERIAHDHRSPDLAGS
jgi:predicted DNA-binding transcriptional regulator YafY